MKNFILISFILFFSCNNEQNNDNYIDVCFKPNIKKFQGIYYMDNNFYESFKVNKKDTIKLILNEDKSFVALNFPIIKKGTSKIIKFINTEGKWNDDSEVLIKHSGQLSLFLNFYDEKLNNDENNVMHEFEKIGVNKKDSSKFVLQTNYYDLDSFKTSILFRKKQ